MSITTYYNIGAYESAATNLMIANGVRYTDSNGQEVGRAATNAMAHSLTSAMLAYDYDPVQSRILGTAREYNSYFLANERPPAWDTYKDLYNNQLGREIGIYARENNLSREQAIDLLWDAYKTDRMIVTSQDMRIPSNFNGNPFNFALPNGATSAWDGPSGETHTYIPITPSLPDGTGDWNGQSTDTRFTVEGPLESGGTARTDFADMNSSAPDSVSAQHSDGTALSVELDPLDTEPWNTHTVSTDADGTVTGDNYDYNTATDWNNDHTLTPADIAELDEQGTSELVGTLQQEAYQGDVVEGAVPTVFTESFFDDANGYNAHELDGGTYDIDVGLLDNNPGTPDTSFDGAVQGLNPPATVALARAGSIPVIASGGLAGMADIEALVRPEHAMLEGAIAGRALYDGRVDVGKALGMMGGG